MTRRLSIGYGSAPFTLYPSPLPYFYQTPFTSGASSGGGGGGGTGFFVDAFPNATNFYANNVTGNDSWDGTSQTFVSGTKGPKASIAGLYTCIPSTIPTGGVALNLIDSGTPYSVGASTPTTLTPPAYSGASPTNQVVLRGLPSSGTLPKIVFGLNSAFNTNANGSRDYFNYWKLDISATSTVSNPSIGAQSLIICLSNALCQQPRVYFCRIHDSCSQDITAGIRIEGTHPNASIRFNYIFNHVNTAGSVNGAGIITYQTQLDIENNEIYGCGCNVYIKRCPPNAPNNGPVILYNYIHDCQVNGYGIYMAEQGAGDAGGFHNSIIAYNLFKNNYVAFSQNNYQNTVQSDTFLLAWNTFAQDNFAAVGWRAMTNVTMHSNIIMATSEKLEIEDAWVSNNFLNTFITGTGTSADTDYNWYLTGVADQWWLDRFPGAGSPQAPAVEYTTFAGWQGLSGRTEFPGGPPDVHGGQFTSVSTNFPNYTSGLVTGYALAAGSAMKGKGQGGTDPGYISTNCGTAPGGW